MNFILISRFIVVVVVIIVILTNLLIILALQYPILFKLPFSHQQKQAKHSTELGIITNHLKFGHFACKCKEIQVVFCKPNVTTETRRTML